VRGDDLMKNAFEQKKWIGMSLFLMTILTVSACGLLPSGDRAPGEALDLPQVTETGVKTLPPSPTITPSPTETPIPPPTLSLTPRATWTPYPTKTPIPTWTPSPTLSPTATKAWGLILTDDFSASRDAPTWFVSEGTNWTLDFIQGKYFMRAKGINNEITSAKSDLLLSDVKIVVDAYLSNGKGYWGISCREASYASYYTVFINSNGEYGYGETVNGAIEQFILGSGLKIGYGEKNKFRLTGECRGESLRLSINDNMLFSVKVAPKIGAGWAGMMVGTGFESEKVVVMFDNIAIYGPIEDE